MSLTIDLGFHSTEWISMSKEFIRSKFFRDAGWVRLQKKILKNKAGYSWMEYYVLLSTHPGENNRNLRQWLEFHELLQRSTDLPEK